MPKITIQPDCGNAPRKLFLKDLIVAWAEGDSDFFTNILPDHITWEVVGSRNISGKANFLNELVGHKLWKSRELVIDTIITHGRDAAVSGRILAADKSVYSFCDVFRFKGAGGSTIDQIRTFLVKGE
jgi:hypothetical protein